MYYKMMCMAAIAIATMYLCSCKLRQTESPSIAETSTATNLPYGEGSKLITITGDNFSTRRADNKVSVNGQDAYIVSASRHQLLINVPVMSGNISVTVTVLDQVSNTLQVQFPSRKSIAANMSTPPGTQF